MGWLGWSALLLAIALLGIGGYAVWAFKTGSVAALDDLDARFSWGRVAIEVEKGRYGPAAKQKVLLFTPSGPPPAAGFPLVAFYHGGSWHYGDASEYRFMARALAARGFATALIGYRLGEKGKYPAMLEDCAAGLRWALDHAAAHGIDTGKVALTGHSAGAYNAVMLALDPRWLRQVGVGEDRIAGVAGLAGPYDFYPFVWDSSRLSFGDWPKPEETQPVRFARADAPPLLLLTGTDDETVRPRNTAALAKAMRAVGAAPEVVQIAGMGHSGPIITLARPFDRDQRVGNALFAFLARVLPSATVKPAGS